VYSSIAPPTVHREGSRSEDIEAWDLPVFASLHRMNDGRERYELGVLGAQERLRFEEGNHVIEEIAPTADHKNQRGVAWTTVVLPDPTTAEPLLEQVEDLPTLRTLADMKVRDQLPTGTGPVVSTYGDVKTSLSVDETG
jgi:hypothetical protein